MTITKYGHSCFLVEEEGTIGTVRILFDPGNFSKSQNVVTGIDCMLITHDHMDHFDMSSVKAILANNPAIVIYTTETVQEALQKEDIASTVLKNGEKADIKGVSIEAVGELHAVIINQMPQIQNIGYMVAGKLFFPGDALTVPPSHVEILALPAAAPWAKMSEIFDYTLSVKPTKAFPVHDAILANPSMFSGMMVNLFKEHDIEFIPIEVNTPTEF
jgi:L-ascorbate metabolism protein UlaG (beta-lactamase superfamily)